MGHHNRYLLVLRRKVSIQQLVTPVHCIIFFPLSLDLSEIDVNTFLGPFLDVIRSEDTTGPITGIALSSVNKFLSYGLVGMYE